MWLVSEKKKKEKKIKGHVTNLLSLYKNKILNNTMLHAG